MAKKKKKAVKYTGEVGHIVKVTWIDSGCSYSRNSVYPEDCMLSVNVTYGKVVHKNKERIVVASQQDQVHSVPRNDTYEVIWHPSIQSIRRLR